MAKISSTPPSERPARRRRKPRGVVGTSGILLHDEGKPGHPLLDDPDALVPDDLYPSADPAQQMSDSLGALSDLAGGILESLAPRLIRDLDHELRERIRRSPIELNSYGYDPWGFNADVARRTLLIFALIYRYYFRVQTTGLENIPAGRVLSAGRC